MLNFVDNHTVEDHTPLPWELFVAELIGTALLVLTGQSLVIVTFGDGSPVARWVRARWCGNRSAASCSARSAPSSRCLPSAG
jgi:hypothetical protein